MSSLNSSLEEEEDGQERIAETPTPEEVHYHKLFAACQLPTYVVIKKLSEEEIQRYLSIVDDNWIKPQRTQKLIAKNYLKDVPRVDFGIDIFAQYKRTRLKKLNKRNFNHSSAEIGDYGFSSGEDVPLPDDDDDFVPEGSSSKKKRRRMAYEEDDDWNPSSTESRHSPKPKKTLRNLRVNTRRKRIESNTSSDDDFENIYDTNTVSDIEPIHKEQVKKKDASVGEKITSRKEQEDGLSSSLLDGDLLSQIMKEMEDFNREKGSEFGKKLSGKKHESSFSGFSGSKQKRRVSRVIKITDDLTPTIRHVQQVVKNMVNTVCSYEKERELAIEASKKINCKWCDVLFLSENKEDELCKICKDVVKLSTTPKNSKRGPKPKNSAKPSAKSSMKSKVLKNLPNSEKWRLMYGEKGHSLNKNLTTVTAEIHPEPPSTLSVTDPAINPAKKKKVKKSSTLSVPKTKVIKTKKRKEPSYAQVEGLTNLKPQPKKIAVEKNSHGKKGLLSIDFPNSALGSEASASLKISANPSCRPNSQTIGNKQSTHNNVQFGTYLLPACPTVVVANYAATDAESGDYYLSSVFYQNEMTQSKNAPGRSQGVQNNTTVSSLNTLPSMPSIDQLSLPFLDQSQNIPVTSTLSFPQSHDSGSLPSVSTSFHINTKMVDNASLENPQVPLATSDSTYSLEQDIVRFLNNTNLQIQPIETSNSSMTTDSDIASLFSNSQLQVEPLITPHDVPFDSVQVDKQQKENDNAKALAHGNERNNPSSDRLSEESDNSVSAPVDPTANKVTNPPKSVTKETKQHLKKINSDSNKTCLEEPSEEDISSEALFRNMSAELDAIAILGVLDLDKSPRFSLERRMEMNKNEIENLRGIKPATEIVRAKLKEFEDKQTKFQLAKTLLDKHGSFSRLSTSCLMFAKILQIKQEKNLEHEETRSSCQFARAQAAPPYVDVMGQQEISLNHIANIETQLTSIPAIDPSQYGTVHHFPAPASMPRSESRETPSRGSGPLTPARPESAMSQADEPALTPLQIKKERLEASSSPLSSECSFATPSAAQMPVVSSHQTPPAYVGNQPQPQTYLNNQPLPQATHVSNQPQQQMSQLSNQPQQQMSQLNNQVSMSSQNTFQILNEMTQRLQNRQSGSQVHNVVNPQIRQMSVVPGNNNQQMHLMSLIPNVRGGRPTMSPNVTAPLNNNPGLSKVLLDFAAQQQSSQGGNANYVIKNGQMMNVQNVQPQHQISTNTNLVNANIMFKNTQMVNVQQVYLPSSPQSRFPTNASGTNQFNIQVQQGGLGQLQRSQGQVTGDSAGHQGIQVQQGSLAQLQRSQGQVLVNNAGSQGYSFEGQQMLGAQQVVPRVTHIESLREMQQRQGFQSSPNPGFLMQNNNKVLFFEIQRPS